jgi:hypothetical protein
MNSSSGLGSLFFPKSDYIAPQEQYTTITELIDRAAIKAVGYLGDLRVDFTDFDCYYPNKFHEFYRNFSMLVDLTAGQIEPTLVEKCVRWMEPTFMTGRSCGSTPEDEILIQEEARRVKTGMKLFQEYFRALESRGIVKVQKFR